MSVLVFILIAAMMPGPQTPEKTGTDGNVGCESVRKAEGMLRELHLARTIDFCKSELEAETDSLCQARLQDVLARALNGKTMMRFCSTPAPVARKQLDINDFYLYYPLADGGWRTVVETTVTETESVTGKGRRKKVEILRDTTRRETVLFTPEGSMKALEAARSLAPDALFPMLSEDGGTLWFSSAKLYGIGGYDLFTSTFDKAGGRWTPPVNMGFPWSSPQDDFLYVTSDDRRYTLFASTRGCGDGAINVYVLDYESVPSRQDISSEEDLQKLMELEPESGSGRSRTEAHRNDPVADAYRNAMASVRRLQDDIFRKACSGRPEDEAAIPSLKEALAKASAAAQDLEMQLVAKGTDPSEVLKSHAGAQSGREPAPAYHFIKNNPGEPLYLETKQHQTI